jgi:hypothetical protein
MNYITDSCGSLQNRDRNNGRQNDKNRHQAKKNLRERESKREHEEKVSGRNVREKK